MDWDGLWHSTCCLVAEKLHKAREDAPWENFWRKFIIMLRWELDYKYQTCECGGMTVLCPVFENPLQHSILNVEVYALHVVL
jgi:hypothetical protein